MLPQAILSHSHAIPTGHHGSSSQNQLKLGPWKYQVAFSGGLNPP